MGYDMKSTSSIPGSVRADFGTHQIFFPMIIEGSFFYHTAAET
jgi:hypothetical protein